jgi:hypothetical protein
VVSEATVVGTYIFGIMQLITLVDMVCKVGIDRLFLGSDQCEARLSAASAVLTVVSIVFFLTGLGVPAAVFSVGVLSALVDNVGPLICKYGIKGFAEKFFTEPILTFVGEHVFSCAPCAPLTKTDDDDCGYGCMRKKIGLDSEQVVNIMKGVANAGKVLVIKLVKTIAMLVKGLLSAAWKALHSIPKALSNLRKTDRNKEVCCTLNTIRSMDAAPLDGTEEVVEEAIKNGADFGAPPDALKSGHEGDTIEFEDDEE